MIVDNLKNISLYKNIPTCVVDFIENLHSNISLGKHVLSDNIYFNVETYCTKQVEDGKFESHNDYIDIQLLLSGSESIYVTSVDGLTISTPYDKIRDISFYSDPLDNSSFVTLNGTNFIMLFPHEAHAPQISPNKTCEEVLKIVVKIKI